MKEVLLYNIRSNYNVGAIFRTADGAGVTKLYLAGYTPAPVDRFGRPVLTIAKTALGAERCVPWERLAVTDVPALLRAKQSAGRAVVVVEQSLRSTMYKNFVPPKSALYIFGSEVEGVPADIIASADLVLELPMCGKKESLNVAVTAGVVLYHSM